LWAFNPKHFAETEEKFRRYKQTAKPPEVLETSAENIMPDTGQ